jgi:hypothetical protein
MVVDVTIVQSQARLWFVKTWLKYIGGEASITCSTSFCNKTCISSARKEGSSRKTTSCSFELPTNVAWASFVQGFIETLLSSKDSKDLATWRCFTAHVEYLVLQISIIRLQRNIRMECSQIIQEDIVRFRQIPSCVSWILHLRICPLYLIVNNRGSSCVQEVCCTEGISAEYSRGHHPASHI